MNFLQGLGGVGAGLVTANQIMRQQKQDGQNAKLKEAQIGLADAQLAKIQRDGEDDEAIRSTLRDAGMRRSGTDADTVSAGLNRSEGFTDDDMQSAGIPATGKPTSRYGLKQAHDAAADVALTRGDMKAYEQQKKYAAMMDQEGFSRGIQMLDSGANVADVEAEMNKYGTTRFATGTLKNYDPEKRVVTMADPFTGKDTFVDINHLERSMLGIGERAKVAKSEADTEESRQKANVLIPAQALEAEKKGLYWDENAKTLPALRDAQAKRAKNGAGGAGIHVKKTIETVNGIVAVMSDGSEKMLKGEDGKPLRGVSGQKIAANLVGKTLSQYGENGNVAEKVNTLADQLNSPKDPDMTKAPALKFDPATGKFK